MCDGMHSAHTMHSPIPERRQSRLPEFLGDER